VLQLSWVSPQRNYLLFTDPMGTAGMITEPNTLAILSQRADFTPVEYESLTDRATRGALEKVGVSTAAEKPDATAFSATPDISIG
jgi:hypothetical protein